MKVSSTIRSFKLIGLLALLNLIMLVEFVELIWTGSFMGGAPWIMLYWLLNLSCIKQQAETAVTCY